MENQDVFSGYFSGYVEGKEVVLHYAESQELAHTYVFDTEEEAENFYQTCLKMGELTSEVSESKQALAHQVLIKESLKGKHYQTMVY
ncbi:MAG: hypothetical protein RR548_03950 [Carnobacterium sp.]|uniref:hypothetical protein n=1 Tax=unclassified Carnobacterium TaxID=257487 RepID=UPI001911A116|nr:hypothetical protein [Carnobacterium sp. CS13]QQP69491.1 hypothetical protein JHE06_07640 [Carnobacterium sp. CS13]